MRRIFKYEIGVTDDQEIILPHDFKVLTAQFKDEELCIWADTNGDYEVRLPIYVFGTGFAIYRRDLTYIATVQQDEFVWHIYHGKPIPIEDN